MKIIVKQFKETLSIKDLTDVLNAQLKANNLNSAGVNIYFKNYPEDLTSELPEGVEYANLNTLVFDTDLNRATVYIQADASDFVKKTDMDELKGIIDNLTAEITEHKEEFEAVRELVTGAQNDISEIQKEAGELKTKVDGISQTQATRFTELQNSIKEADGKADTNKTELSTVKGNITSLINKDSELDGKVTALEGRVAKLETPAEKGTE